MEESSIASDGYSHSVSCQQNPWINDRSIGSQRAILDLAEKTGLSQRGRLFDEEKMKEDLFRSSFSLKMIALHRSIKKTKCERDEANLDIQCHLRDKEMKDLTHADILDDRVKKIHELIQYLESIIKQKEALISRLQQPFVSDYIKIEAAYQKHASEVVPLLVPMLSDLPTTLDRIAWSAQLKNTDPQLDELLTDTATVLSSQQAIYQHISKIRTAMQRLQTQRHRDHI